MNVIKELQKMGVYEKLKNRYKANNFRIGRTIKELVNDNKYLNMSIEDIRYEYHNISKKLLLENNYTEPEKRDYEQIKIDELLRDKISFALDYAIYKNLDI